MVHTYRCVKCGEITVVSNHVIGVDHGCSCGREYLVPAPNGKREEK